MRSRRCSNLSSAGTKNPSGHVGADDRTSARLKLEIHASPKNMLVECNLVANSPVVIEAGIPKINVEIFKFGSNHRCQGKFDAGADRPTASYCCLNRPTTANIPGGPGVALDRGM